MPKSRALAGCTIPAHLAQQEKWTQLPGPASLLPSILCSPVSTLKFCPFPHWACSETCSICLPSPSLPPLPAHQRPSLLSLPFWPVASVIWFLACWPTSMCQDLLLQPAVLQVSTFQEGEEGEGREKALVFRVVTTLTVGSDRGFPFPRPPFPHRFLGSQAA